MLQFSKRGGMPVITIRNPDDLQEAIKVARSMPDRDLHRAEIIINTDDRIIEVSEDKVKIQGRGNCRPYKITDPRWRGMLNYFGEVHFLIKSRDWFFSMRRDPVRGWDGMGVWYSAQMLLETYGGGVTL